MTDATDKLIERVLNGLCMPGRVKDIIADRIRKELAYDGDALEPLRTYFEEVDAFTGVAVPQGLVEALAESKARVAVIEAERKAARQRSQKWAGECGSLAAKRSTLIDKLKKLAQESCLPLWVQEEIEKILGDPDA